jgi:hypothetical protein
MVPVAAAQGTLCAAAKEAAEPSALPTQPPAAACSPAPGHKGGCALVHVAAQDVPPPQPRKLVAMTKSTARGGDDRFLACGDDEWRRMAEDEHVLWSFAAFFS